MRPFSFLLQHNILLKFREQEVDNWEQGGSKSIGDLAG